MSTSADEMDKLLQALGEFPGTDWPWSFDHSATGESAQNAVALANLALLAYSGESGIGATLERWGFDPDFQFLKKEHTAGFVARRTDAGSSSVFIAFRGTEPTMLVEFLLDIRYDQITLDGIPGKVHGGFGLADEMVTDQTADALARLPGDRHYFTGHSLGGALTVLAAAAHMQQVTAVYTYGQPRVGDQAFSDAYDAVLGDVTFRYVNNFDIVPHVPPEILPTVPKPFAGKPFGIPLSKVVGAVRSAITGEPFTHVGQLRLFIDGQPVSQDVAEFRARDPFVLDVSLNPLADLQSVRNRLDQALNEPRRLLDHDPVTGYLPRLQNRLGAG